VLRRPDLPRAAQHLPRRAVPANATDMNASPNPCGRLPPRTPSIARAVPRTNNRPAANATGGTGNDQFAVERLGADCRRLWLSRHAGCVPPLRSALTR